MIKLNYLYEKARNVRKKAGILCLFTGLVLCSCGKSDKKVYDNVVSEDVAATSETVSEAYEFTWNPYTVPLSYELKYGDTFDNDYKKIVDAYLSYETRISLETRLSGNYMQQLESALRTGFPLLDQTMRLSEEEENNTITITYLESQEEFQKDLEELKEVTKSWLTPCLDQGDSGAEAAKKIYTYFTHHMTYNQDILKDPKHHDGSSYHALTEQEGICQSFARAYVYLLMQAGMEADTCSGMNKDDESHMWTVIKLDDEYYFSDPTFGLRKPAGNLKYFAFSAKEREKEFPADTFSYGAATIEGNDTIPVTSDKYEVK